MSFTYVSLNIERKAGHLSGRTAKSIRVVVSGLEQRLYLFVRSSFDVVGEESSYVRTNHLTYCTYTCILCQLLEHHLTASGLISFHTIRDKFTGAIVHVNLLKTLVGLKRISEAGTQQLLLNVYDETIPVLEVEKTTGTFSRHHAADSLSGGSTTKMVNKEFRKLEVR